MKKEKPFFSKFLIAVSEIFILLMLVSCEFFNVPVNNFLKEYTESVQIVNAILPSQAYPKNTEGIPILPSSENVTIQFTLRNPQQYKLNASVRFPNLSGSFDTLKYVQVAQKSDDPNIIELILPAAFLYETDCGCDISAIITVSDPKTGRVFPEFTLPLICNTPPQEVSGGVMLIDTTEGSPTNNQYCLCFNLPGTTITKALHKDIEQILVNGESFPITVGEDGTMTIESTKFLTERPISDDATSSDKKLSFTPRDASIGQAVYFWTGRTVSAEETIYTIELIDSTGLISTYKVSSIAKQLGELTVKDNEGNTVTHKQTVKIPQNKSTLSGNVIINLPSDVDSSGATINYAAYLINAINSEDESNLISTGNATKSSLTISLPPGKYIRLKTYSSKSIYADSNIQTINFQTAATKLAVDPSFTGTSYGTYAAPYKSVSDAVEGLLDKTSTSNEIALIRDITYSEAVNAIKFETVGMNLTLCGETSAGTPYKRTINANKNNCSVITVSTGTITLKNLIITGGKNSTGNGGGVSITNEAEVTLDGVTVSGNLAYNGGGVAVVGNSSSLTLTNGTVIGNKTATSAPTDVDSALDNGGNAVTNAVDSGAASCVGGGIFASNTSSITIKKGCYVSGNISYSVVGHDFGKGELGGGIFINETATLTIGETSNDNEQVYIQYNSVGVGRGGGIAYCTAITDTGKGNGSIKNTVIRENTAKYGGGVYVNKENASLTLNKCILQKNFTSSHGGGIYMRGNNANVYLSNSTITQNTANSTGPGIWICGDKAEVEPYSEEIPDLHLSGNLQIEDVIHFNTNNCHPIQIDGEFTNTTKISLYWDSSQVIPDSHKVIQGNGYDLIPADCNKFTIKDKPNLRITLNGENSGVLTDMSTTFYVDSDAAIEGDGTLEKPFRTIQDAVDTVIETNDTLTPPGSKVFTIYLKGEFTDDTEANRSDNGDAFVNINSSNKLNLTITGYNDDTTATINANRTSGSSIARVMNINMEDTTNESSIMLSNLKLTGGYINGNGGGLSVTGKCELTISDCEISNNKLNDISEEIDLKGAGVYVGANSKFTMNGGSISNNEISGDYTKGAGVFIDGTGTFAMKEGLISNNTVKTNDAKPNGGDGGGIYVEENGSLYMDGGSITNNTAERNGGGVYLADGSSTFTMTNGTITGNKTTSTSDGCGRGAGVYVRSTETNAFTMSGGSISSNTASSGGGAVWVQNSSFTMSGTATIASNKGTSGGGIGVDNSTFIMKGGTIGGDNEAAGNIGSASGGGVHVSSNSTFTMSGGFIKWNKGSTTSGNGGGGVHVNNSTFKMTDGEISYNNAKGFGGSGVCEMNSATFEMNGGSINNNETTLNGGGVYLADGSVFKMSGDSTKISYNTAHNGAGVYVNSNTVIEGVNGFTMEGGIISENIASIGGGGVLVSEKGGFYIQPATGDTTCSAKITGNKASLGAGVYVNKGSFTMSSGTIGGDTEGTGNNATMNGGGVYVVNSGTFTMKDNAKISHNTANGHGGGACISIGNAEDNTTKGIFNLEGGTIDSNTAKQSGGGVYVDSGTFKMSGGTIGGEGVGNTATVSGGGVYLYTNSVFTMSNGTISDNNAYSTENGGGGVFVNADSAFIMSGGTIGGKGVGNTATHEGGGVYLANGSVFKMSGENTTISYNTAQTGGGVCVKTSTDAKNSEALKKITEVTGIEGFTMESGTISYNTANKLNEANGNGGGVYISLTGKFIMKSASCFISNNTADHAAGVDVGGGTFIMDNGTISKNEATGTDAGGVYVSGPFTMKGGTITENTAPANSGGVRVGSGTFTMTGGSITKNTTSNEDSVGGGVYLHKDGTFNLSGAPVITDNTSNGANNNVYLLDDKFITITGTLTNTGTTQIDVSTQTTNIEKRITSGYGTYNTGISPVTYFFSDASKTVVYSEFDPSEAAIQY